MRLLLTFSVLLASSLHAAEGKLIITYLNLQEHGLAVVVQTPGGKTWMIDTGPQADKYDAGRDTIAPFLKARGITKLDGIAISHPHADHYGGARWLIENLPVATLVDTGYAARGFSLTYNRLRERARERGANYLAATEGDTLDFDPALTVEVLSPPKGMHNTSPEFALATSPKFAIASCLDFYEGSEVPSPGEKLTKQFESLGTKVFVTAWHGNIEITSDGIDVTAKTEREGKGK